MAQDLEPRGGTSVTKGLGRRAIAAVVLLIAGYVLLRVVLSVVTSLALPIVGIAAVIAVIWAWRALR